ncbi:hypothetical protein ANCCEY_01453 [Ancylostoma ceylanicum]|uniref:Uncharacterized protein n=1 Tax=Ancylostoma ceylanicum TaxID=53326 RepID=A0A0D6MAC0_9BILA|nr:hypothetical protein ANCCEY_01453 [Ancylostoma ceylanicum]
MRMWCALLLLLVNAVTAQFNLFGDSHRESSQIAAIGDQFGVRDALGAWSRVLRNMATRPQAKRVTPPNPRDFTISPNVKREDLKKILEEKKNGDNIINERLLYLLLPRTISEFVTFQAILEREYLRKLAQLKAQKKERENRRHLEYAKDNEETENEEKEDEATEETTTTTATTTTTERTTKPPKNSQQFTVVFHTASKEDFEEKAKMESKVRSILSNTITERESEQRKISEAKKSMEKVNKEPESIEETTTDESSTASEIVETTEIKPTSVEAVAEAALRNALKEKEEDTEEFVEHSKAYAASLLSQQSDASPEQSTAEPSTTTVEEVVTTAETPETTMEPSTDSTTTSEPEPASTHATVPPNILNTEEAAEVNEVLSLIEADEKAEKAEGIADSEEIKRLRESTRAKIMAFLQRRENNGAILPEQ